MFLREEIFYLVKVISLMEGRLPNLGMGEAIRIRRGWTLGGCRFP